MSFMGIDPPKEKPDVRKQTPLRMDPELYEKLSAKAKEQNKSVNTLICDVLETYCSEQPGGMLPEEVKRKIRNAIEQEVRRSGWAPQAPDIQAAIYAALGLK